jgi:4-diphosphocytidyl-2-C-methyl-D-erythritol kinase
MIRIKSYAKVNLTLDLVGKREDGYHLLRSVMQKVSLCDIISMQKQKEEITLTCSKRYIPTDERNIAYKVAKAFFDSTGIAGGVKINIKKHIPCGAGLGGGSSNGAAVLDGLCELYGVDMTAEQKGKLCESIGADIPFFFYSSTALIEGIGEKVTPLKKLPECRMVIVKPPKSISTPVIFKHPATAKAFGTNSTDAVISAINEGDIYKVCENVSNALEAASIEVCGEIEDIKKELKECGALCSMMSGSGSAVFGIFKTPDSAKKAYNRMLKKYKDTYIAKGVI